MHKKLFALIKPLLKPFLIASLVITLVLGHADGALAARSGGRIGGGSFRAPSGPTYSSPRTYAPPSGGYGYGYGYPGGGIGFPFVFPLFGFGGFGGLFTILIFISIAGFLVRTLRSVGSGDGGGYTTGSSNVSIAELQVGLLSEARSLQADLNRIAEAADTSSSAGLAQVLQETTLALLRHPEYWIYAGAKSSKQLSLEAAENQFNRLALAERSKFTEETLSNVNNLLKHAEARQALQAAGGQLATADIPAEPGEYIVVTVLVAAQGNKLQLPPVNNTQDLRQALSQIGSVSSEDLLALEVLWTPQAEGDTLSAEDVLVGYPDLKLI